MKINLTPKIVQQQIVLFPLENSNVTDLVNGILY